MIGGIPINERLKTVKKNSTFTNCNLIKIIKGSLLLKDMERLCQYSKVGENTFLYQ